MLALRSSIGQGTFRGASGATGGCAYVWSPSGCMERARGDAPHMPVGPTACSSHGLYKFLFESQRNGRRLSRIFGQDEPAGCVHDRGLRDTLKHCSS
jgi:hypothetical protein